MTRYLIETPTPFASLETWKEFLESLADYPNDRQIISARKTARKHIARLEAEMTKQSDK